MNNEDLTEEEFEALEFEKQQQADREVDDYLLEIILNKNKNESK